MKCLDFEKYKAALEAQITKNEKEISHAAKNGYWEKAYRYECNNEGLKKALFLVNVGDYVVPDK